MMPPGLPPAPLQQFNEFTWQLNNLLDQTEILQYTLRETPRLIEAASAAIWLWDNDQQAPVVMVTTAGQDTSFSLSSSLLQLMRQACARNCAFAVDAGETDASWPAALAGQPVAFIPLPEQSSTDRKGYLGILTVHAPRTGEFTYEQIFLLSSLGILVATAVRNVQLYTSERRLNHLLQTSIRQVVQAVSSPVNQPDELVLSLLQVAEGLTHPAGICVSFGAEHMPVTEAVSGTLTMEHDAEMRDIAHRLRALLAQQALPSSGSLALLLEREALPESFSGYYYMLAPVTLGGEVAGLIYALRATSFTPEQLGFLQTMAEQIGASFEQIQRSVDWQQLLIEIANVNYVSQAISSTFDSKKILSIITQAASQALNAPIAFCGWCDDDGIVRVLPGTAIGLPPESAQGLEFPTNNSIIRTVIEQRLDVSSRAKDRRGRALIYEALGEQVQDWVCVPMVVKHRARGILLVADTRVRIFSSRDVALLSTYANQAALAMENSLLYEQVDHQLQQMELLYHVTHTVSQALDQQVIMSGLLQSALEALRLPAALVFLAEEATGVQQYAAAMGVDATQLAGARWLPGEGLVGIAAAQGVPITSTHIARDGREMAVLRNLALHEGLTSALIVPLRAQRQVLGTLMVLSQEPREFTPAEAQLLQAMATEAAVATRNARRLAEEREHARGLRMQLNAVVRQTEGTLQFITQMLEITQQTEPETLGIERARLRLESITAMQFGVPDDDPLHVDIKRALTNMIEARFSRLREQQESARFPDIKITGARIFLPIRAALALGLLIHEWLLAVWDKVLHNPQAPLIIAFQQFGREVLVHIDDSGDWQENQAPVNHAIISLATRILPGTISETLDSAMHHIRFRFSAPE